MTNALWRALLFPWRRFLVRRYLRSLSPTQALWAIVEAPADPAARVRRFEQRLQADRERRT